MLRSFLVATLAAASLIAFGIAGSAQAESEITQVKNVKNTFVKLRAGEPASERRSTSTTGPASGRQRCGSCPDGPYVIWSGNDGCRGWQNAC
jgi:hypothetical protein